MRVLKRGDIGPEVGLLRRMLNRKLVPSPNLPEANVFGARYNGAMGKIDFGPQMEAAVKKFQRLRGLKESGVVDAATWSALGLTSDISWPISAASQPTNDTCYAASATMLLGPRASASFNSTAAPPGVAPDDYWAKEFAKQFSWTLEYGMTPMPNGLANFLRAGAFWFCGNLPFPAGPSYHAVVAAAIWGDGDVSRTMLLIYDPWPVNVGETYGIILGDYIQAFPQAFRYIIHR
jgi:Putative peptidoglycan binding domain